MLNGDPFLQYDEQLMDERAHCTGAVWNFNGTASPSVFIAGGELERHFKRIVAAAWIRPHDMDPRPGAPKTGGHLGGNVKVNTPFHCDYGYNISIGDNVIIGPHCQLLDSARIAIGRNTKIGARCTISTLKTPTDVKSLKGSNGTELARDVHIGENVYIGDSVVIEAGVRIGNNAIIRAGSVVVRVSTITRSSTTIQANSKQDIASNVVAHGNPAFG
jgi:acetyltransferase-like isoleucine patch superfamily enzyme